LGESWQININLNWEQTRYLASIIYNTNVTKKRDLITPEKLFKLPQDVYNKQSGPKSTPEQYEAFKERANKVLK
jgi:hypothetical protein